MKNGVRRLVGSEHLRSRPGHGPERVDEDVQGLEDARQLVPVLAMVQRVSATTSTASKTAGISVPVLAMAHSTLNTAYTDSKTATISVPVSAMAQGS